MITRIILFFKCVVLFYCYDALSIKLDKFVAYTTIHGNKCDDDNVIFSMTNSATACALACWKEPACLSMVYYPDTRRCTGCISFLSANGNDPAYFYVPKHQYIGCYSDNPRITNGSSIQYPGMTTQYCLVFCLVGDYRYTITEDGDHCRCGKTVDWVNAVKKPETDCNVTCAGDSSQTCGGDRRASLYRTGV